VNRNKAISNIPKTRRSMVSSAHQVVAHGWPVTGTTTGHDIASKNARPYALLAPEITSEAGDGMFEAALS
jgi:hypothetical protein